MIIKYQCWHTHFTMPKDLAEFWILKIIGQCDIKHIITSIITGPIRLTVILVIMSVSTIKTGGILYGNKNRYINFVKDIIQLCNHIFCIVVKFIYMVFLIWKKNLLAFTFIYLFFITFEMFLYCSHICDFYCIPSIYIWVSL